MQLARPLRHISKRLIVLYALVVIGCWWSIRWLERPRHVNRLGLSSVDAIQRDDEIVRKKIESLWVRIERVLAGFDNGYVEQLNPPISEDELAEVENELGYALPAALRASLRIHNGTRREFVSRYRLYDGAGMVSTRDMYISDAVHYVQELLEPEVSDRYWWHPGWIPVGGWEAYEIFVNLETGAVCWFDESSGVWQASSWMRWLENIATRLESGDLRPKEPRGWTRQFDTPGSEVVDDD